MKTSTHAAFCYLVLLYSHFGLNARAQELTKLLEFGGPNQAQTGLIQGSNTQDGKPYGVVGSSSTGLGTIYRLNLDGTGFETIPAASLAERSKSHRGLRRQRGI